MEDRNYRNCEICKAGFPLHGRPANAKTCSPQCAKALQRRRVKEARERAKANDPNQGAVICPCGTEFVKVAPNARYCSDPCREQALRKAVQRQADRRKASQRVVTGKEDRKIG